MTGGEERARTGLPGWRIKIDGEVVIGGDGKFNSFPGQGNRSFVHRRIAVPAVGERMNVRIAADQSRRRHFTVKLKINGAPVAGRKVTLVVARLNSKPRVALNRYAPGSKWIAARPSAV